MSDLTGLRATSSVSHPIRRIAVTLPPDGTFYGISSRMTEIYRQSLIDLGLSVFCVPTGIFLQPDIGQISSLISDLRAFDPQIAIGLPNATHALICRLPPGRDGWRPNLFTEVLDIPTICLWDFAPYEIARYILLPRVRSADGHSGACETLRRTFAHPRLVHCSRDTWQTQLMHDLGFVQASAVVQVHAAALPGFASAGHTPQTGPTAGPDVSFIGHINQDAADHGSAAHADLAAAVIGAWLQDHERPLWDVLADHVASLSADQRKQLTLERDQAGFWHFAEQVIVRQAQAAARMRVLGAAKIEIACYGNLQADDTALPRNVRPIPGHIEFGPPLAAAFRRHPIMIDVIQPGWVNGYSYKPLLAFAAGGFSLLNRKKDFVANFGEPGELVTFKDEDELRAKLDRFLTSPKLRREVGDAMRAEIEANHRLDQVLARIIGIAAERYHDGPPSGSRGSAYLAPDTGTSIVVSNLLDKIRTHAIWRGASVDRDGDARVVTLNTVQWAYAAEIPIAAPPAGTLEPHVQLSLVVEAGSVAIVLVRRDRDEVLSQQFFSRSQVPITATVELGHLDGIALIFRNAAGGPSRVRVTAAALCDRKR